MTDASTGLSPQIRILPGGDQRLLAGVGVVDPTSLDSYRKAGGARPIANTNAAHTARPRLVNSRRLYPEAHGDTRRKSSPIACCVPHVDHHVGARSRHRFNVSNAICAHT